MTTTPWNEFVQQKALEILAEPGMSDVEVPMVLDVLQHVYDVGFMDGLTDEPIGDPRYIQ